MNLLLFLFLVLLFFLFMCGKLFCKCFSFVLRNAKFNNYVTMVDAFFMYVIFVICILCSVVLGLLKFMFILCMFVILKLLIFNCNLF